MPGESIPPPHRCENLCRREYSGEDIRQFVRADGLRLSDEEIAETLELARWLLREGLAAPVLRDEHGERGIGCRRRTSADLP